MVTVSSNTISGNTAVLTGSLTSNAGHGYYPGGGGIDAACWDLPTCQLSFVGNTFSNNLTAQSLTIGGSNANGGVDGSLRISEARATLNRILVKGYYYWIARINSTELGRCGFGRAW